MSAPSEVSVYDRMCWPDGQLEQALARGAHRRELIAYFGEGEYARLTALARQAAGVRRSAAGVRRARARPPSVPRAKIYLLPGLLGSQLGWRRGANQPPDLLWLDPLDVVKGRLTALRCRRGRRSGAGGPAEGSAAGTASPSLPACSGLTPLGAIPYSYLALKLRLSAFGFEVVLHDYDWRCDLSAVASSLASRLEADSAEQLVLIGHSMGGLLARAALARCSADTAGRRITRVIGVGAPHGGSIGAVQALRATYPVVLRLAAIDREHDAEALTTTTFRSFMSLYQMLPAARGRLDLFDPAAWPARRAQPDPVLLAAARGFSAALAPADARFVSIIGTGQRTVTGIARQSGQFRYEVSAAGDGTVAAACATLPGARNYSLSCEHSELPRSERVAAALIELLLHGGTRRLREGIRASKGRCICVTDAMLRHAFDRKLDWHRLSAASKRRYLNRLNAPPALYRPPR